MARELPARFGIAPHATRRLTTRQIVSGGVLAVAGATSVAAGLGLLGVAIGAVGVALVGIGAYTRGTGPAAQVVNRAFDAASAGQRADAEELLDYAEETFRQPFIQRVVDLQKAMLAMRRGDLDAALARADAAVTRPFGLIERGQEQVHAVAARGVRALLRAGAGDVEGAQGDIEAVRASPDATPEALARAELAAAVLLERAGDRAALADHLARERALLVEHTHPRERAIVRAYQRMLRAKAESVYRRSAPREADAGDEAGGWIAKIAPGAAPFVRAVASPGEAGAGGVEKILAADPVEPRRAPREPDPGPFEPPRTLRPIAKVGLLWGILIVLFLAIWQMLGNGPRGAGGARAEPIPASILVNVVGAAVVVALAGLVVVQLARMRRQARRLFAANAALARGHEASAQEELAALARSRSALVAAQACLSLASAAERRPDFEEMRRQCGAGIARLGTRAMRAVASDILLPELLARRAFALAALGRTADARAEVVALGSLFPSFPYLARAQLRVALVIAARRGDLAAAAALADRAVDLHLGPRDELLADLARAASRPGEAGAGEVDRLKDELRASAASRRWIEAIAPAVLTAFTGIDAEPAPHDEQDEEAEAELAATEEAARAEAEARGLRAP